MDRKAGQRVEEQERYSPSMLAKTQEQLEARVCTRTAITFSLPGME